MEGLSNMDWLEFMSRYQDKQFDLSPADFPYGIGEAGKNHKSRGKLVRQKGGQLRRAPSNNYSRKDWDNKVPDKEVFDELKRITVNQIYFGANYMLDKIDGTGNFKTPRRKNYKYFIREFPKSWIIWDKVNGTNDFNDCELIYCPTYEFDSFIYKYMWSGMLQGKGMFEGHIMQGNKALNEKRIHPTQKPVNLYRYLYWFFKPKSIVDVCAGSFSSIEAAESMNISYQANERDGEYFQNGTTRIKIVKETKEQKKRQLIIF
jgi:site-specific DNA-methyltransferase (adenine-specific)